MTQEIDDEDNLFELYHSSGNVRDDERRVEPEDETRGHNSGDDDLKDLDFNDLLIEARKELLKDLLTLVRKGHASPAEKSTLRQMLKDNGMVMGDPFDDPPTNGTPNGKQGREPLPEFGPPDYEGA